MQIKGSSVKISLTFLTLIVLATVPNFNVVKGHSLISVTPGLSDITMSTDKMTLKINDYKPDFSFWYANESFSLESYNVRFTKIEEYFGTNDNYLDSIDELGGISYNLLSSNWDYTIQDLTQEVIVNLTLSGLVNDAAIQFIIHIYSAYSELDYTGTYINRFTEAHVEVIIKNWKFTTGARGIAIKTEVYESEKVHDVVVENSTSFLGTNLHGMDFISDEGPTFEKSYMRWVTLCDYYEDDIFQVNQMTGTTFFNDSYSNPADEITHPWFSYPNVNDSLVINHDVILGVYDQDPPLPTTHTANIFLGSIIGGILVIEIIVIIYKKRVRR